jgi:predicted acylesterase/phospholipase RssA
VAQIFISYSSKHRELTRALSVAIEAQYGAGSVWWDRELESRASYSEQIKAALERARVVVVIWTAGAIISDYVYAEANTAQAQGKLVNLRPADISFREIPEPFNIYHIDEAEDHDRILATIAKVMAGTPIPTRVPLHEIYFRQHGQRLIDPKQRALPRDLRQIGPTDLLQAKYEIAPYVDITGAKADFIAWCHNSSRAVAGRLVHGPGGFGKTRLMIDVAATLRSDGWTAGFFDRPHEQIDATLKQRWQALDQLIAHGDDSGLLIVMDYAEGRQDEVKDVVDRLSSRLEGFARPIRLVLLTRTDSTWWTTLHDQSLKMQSVFRRDAQRADVIALSDAWTGRQRYDLFLESVKAFGPALAAQGFVIRTGEPPQDLLMQIETGKGYARPLAVQMAALLWCIADPPSGVAGVDVLLQRIVGLERAHWKKLLGILDDDRERDLARGVAQVTIVQGTNSRPSTERLLMADQFYKGQRIAPVQVDPIIRSLERAYGKPDCGIAHLEPDLIGEHHAAMVSDEDLIEGCLHWIGDEPAETQARHRHDVLTLLQRATRPEHGATASSRAFALLDHLVKRSITPLASDMAESSTTPLASDVVAVMRETPGVMGRLLAREFLAGRQLKFEQADALWRQLRYEDEFSLARIVLQQMREQPVCLIDGVPDDASDHLCRAEALLTSMDPELAATVRHDAALKLLLERFDFHSKALDGDGETLGVAAGICKRRWNDFGQLKDLIQAAEFYGRGARGDLGDDAYPHINAAFLDDLLAAAGDRPEERRERARQLRERIIDELPATGTWRNAATRAEALLGLGQYVGATEALKQVKKGEKREPWELRTTAQQLGRLAHLREKRLLRVPEIRTFFETLLPGAADAVRSAVVGKVGLALSGGGFRASYYHLGVFACLAEHDVLRDVEVLSCVSGGSIVGACYWLMLRQRLLRPEPLTREDYIRLVRELIAHFQQAIKANLRRQIQPSVAGAVWRLMRGKGMFDPDETAEALEEYFYRPLWSGPQPIRMDQLAFTPADHNPALAGPGEFDPGKHNWLRAHKVPALVLNATTVNTGHAWRFTPTWMGETPWAIHEPANGIPRLAWSHYDTAAGWEITLGRAVVASTCTPGVFTPVRMGKHYEGLEVSLVDGAMHGDQGTGALLASDCTTILVSDACNHLVLEPTPASGLKRLTGFTRSINILAERARLANFAGLEARRRSGLLRGLALLDMKAGLDADTIRLRFSQEAYNLPRAPLSPTGVRTDFQQALAELRTDLDVFTPDESCALMACGYQMASKTLYRDLPELKDLWLGSPYGDWPFKEMLEEITSVKSTTARRDALLKALRAGSKVRL